MFGGRWRGKESIGQGGKDFTAEFGGKGSEDSPISGGISWTIGRRAGGALTDSRSDSTPTESGGHQTILVAVDFSADSEAAVVWASRYAALVGAELLILHVIHDPEEAPGYYRRSEKDSLRPMEDVAKEMLEEFLETVQRKHSEVAEAKGLKTELVKGIPATRILEAAESADAALIVMGSRGRTGLPHLLLGSKAERVVQMSPRPVTIVKSGIDHTQQQ
jgi:nucleotide-binding universal stress UspA family protein